MGTLIYGDIKAELEDRLLMHVKAASSIRIADGETFSLVLTATRGGQERTLSMIVGPSIPLAFETEAHVEMDLNTKWLDALLGNRGSYLMICPEPLRSV